MPYLAHAYALARRLARNEHDAMDIVQEAYLRALHYYRGFRGGDFRPCLLKIVRNTFYTWRLQYGAQNLASPDPELIAEDPQSRNPEELAIVSSDTRRLQGALDALPPRLRELLVLREFEGLSYREISTITGVPLGTVMSGLSRARTRLRAALCDGHPSSDTSELTLTARGAAV